MTDAGAHTHTPDPAAHAARETAQRRRIEDELARLSRAQRMRGACSETLVRATSEAELLHAVCRVAVEIGGYCMGWVGMALIVGSGIVATVLRARAAPGAPAEEH